MFKFWAFTTNLKIWSWFPSTPWDISPLLLLLMITLVTTGRPTVRVPVLSNTIVSIDETFSRISPPRMRRPLRAPRDVPTYSPDFKLINIHTYQFIMSCILNIQNWTHCRSISSLSSLSEILTSDGSWLYHHIPLQHKRLFTSQHIRTYL